MRYAWLLALSFVVNEARAIVLPPWYSGPLGLRCGIFENDMPLNSVEGIEISHLPAVGLAAGLPQVRIWNQPWDLESWFYIEPSKEFALPNYRVASRIQIPCGPPKILQAWIE